MRSNTFVNTIILVSIVAMANGNIHGQSSIPSPVSTGLASLIQTDIPVPGTGASVDWNPSISFLSRGQYCNPSSTPGAPMTCLNGAYISWHAGTKRLTLAPGISVGNQYMGPVTGDAYVDYGNNVCGRVNDWSSAKQKAGSSLVYQLLQWCANIFGELIVRYFEYNGFAYDITSGWCAMVSNIKTSPLGAIITWLFEQDYVIPQNPITGAMEPYNIYAAGVLNLPNVVYGTEAEAIIEAERLDTLPAYCTPATAFDFNLAVYDNGANQVCEPGTRP